MGFTILLTTSDAFIQRNFAYAPCSCVVLVFYRWVLSLWLLDIYIHTCPFSVTTFNIWFECPAIVFHLFPFLYSCLLPLIFNLCCLSFITNFHSFLGLYLKGQQNSRIVFFFHFPVASMACLRLYFYSFTCFIQASIK